MTPLIEDSLEPSRSTQTSAPFFSSPPSERPQPRPPRTPAHAARIRVRNRRREWLSRNPSYLRSLEHELADPVLYDALIRRFQSAEEREAEGRAKGFGRVLEVDLLRGEARLAKLADDAARGAGSGSLGDGGLAPGADSAAGDAAQMSWEELEALETHGLEKRSAPQTAEEGRTRWDEFLRLRFVAGGDDEFDYRVVDEDDEYDALERREQEDAWFDNEEPGWVGESDEGDDEDEMGVKGKEKQTVTERPLTGETGIQDF
ncbi:coiled-coil domain-containing protein-domain-containing protein [Xylaria palmicola]|nr:coiled-coil domain-containing protein-domain-containing protein [Xylaria palmicola]